MSHMLGHIIDPNAIDDRKISTSDFLLGELDELESEYCTNWWGNTFSRRPVYMAENCTAFEDVDLIGPVIADDKSVRESKTFFLTPSSGKRPSGSFTYIVVTTPAALYIPLEEPFGQSLHHTRFSPDFYSIKKFVGYIIHRTGTPLLQQIKTCKTVKDIPVAIHPQAVREAEENTLTNDLEGTINLAKETYSTLNRIEVNLERDPEIVERKTIRFTLIVSGDPDTVLENETLFKKHLYRSISHRASELITVTYSWDKQ